MVNFAFTLDNFEYWLLILVRITCFIYIAPFLDRAEFQIRLKLGYLHLFRFFYIVLCHDRI